MKNIHIAILSLLFGIFGLCSDLLAQQNNSLSYDPYFARMAKILGSNPDISVFQIDPLKNPGPKAHESHEKYQQRLDAFIETQRKNSKQLTENQKQELIKILLNPRNYWAGLYSVTDSQTLGIDIKVTGDSATLICGDEIIISSHNGKQINALLNKIGSKAFKQWRDDVLRIINRDV